MNRVVRSSVWIGLLSVGLAGCDSGTPGRRDRPLPNGSVVAGFDRGDLAPDIEGTDADGKPFKLSDYRGKVVLLKFWHST